MNKSLLIASFAVLTASVFGMIPNNPNGTNLGKRNFSQIRESSDGSDGEEQRRRRISVPTEQQNQAQRVPFQATNIRSMFFPVENGFVQQLFYFQNIYQPYPFYSFNYQTNQWINQPSQMRLPQQFIQRNPQVPAENERESAETSRSAFFEPSKEELEEMYSALWNGNIEIVKKFINKGIDINGCIFRTTPLNTAIKGGHIDLVKYLIENGADINKADKSGDQTPLGSAVKKLASTKEDENRELFESIIRYLVDKGADVNMLSFGYTPLNLLINKLHETINEMVSKNQRRRHIEACENMIKYLVDHGADVNGKNKRVGTSAWGHLEDEETPLHLATNDKSLDMVKYLVEHGADINARTRFGVTPLLKVTKSNYVVSDTTERLNIIKYLIDKGAEINYYSESDGTPLSNISKFDSIDAIKYLLDHGANPNLGKGEYSPLISQIWKHGSKPEIVKLLLDYGASRNEADEKGRTALMMASYKGHKDIVKMLVHNDGLFEQYVISMVLASKNRTRMTDKAISKISTKIEGALPILVNAKDKSGKTALIYAIESKLKGLDKDNTRYDIVKTLLDSGANPNIKTKRGRTPLIYAASKNLEDIARLLLERGADLSGALNILNKSKSRSKGPLIDFLSAFVAPEE